MALFPESKAALRKQLNELNRKKKIAQSEKRRFDGESSKLEAIIASIDDDITKIDQDLKS